MTDQDDSLLNALTTEHFALQSAAVATITESSDRALIYLSALSSSLVAIGFASSKPAVLAVFVSTLLPVVFLMGIFTLVRVIDTNVESIAASERIAAIRRYYAGLHEQAPFYFPPSRLERLQRRGIGRIDMFFTMGTMIALVNAALGGAITTLLLQLIVQAPTALSVVVGLLVGAALLIVALAYQDRRTRPVIESSTPSAEPRRV